MAMKGHKVTLACRIMCWLGGHHRYEQESFSTWSSIDMLTGDDIDRGYKKNKTKVFCSRCGKDIEDVASKTK